MCRRYTTYKTVVILQLVKLGCMFRPLPRHHQADKEIVLIKVHSLANDGTLNKSIYYSFYYFIYFLIFHTYRILTQICGYADDILVIATSLPALEAMCAEISREAGRVGLVINPDKTIIY